MFDGKAAKICANMRLVVTAVGAREVDLLLHGVARF